VETGTRADGFDHDPRFGGGSLLKHFTTFDGLRLAYSDEGEGLPVLCLSGLTRSFNDFDYVAPHMPGVRMIRMDYRGRGQSEWAKDWSTYSVPAEGQDAMALLDHLGLEKATILGTSRGGLIAMMLAATVKDRLLGVCLNDIGPVLEGSGLDRIMSILGRNPAFKTRADMAAAMPEVKAGFANVPMKRWISEVEKHTFETPEGLTITYDPKLREALLAKSAQPSVDLWPLFEAMAGLPVALIRGANSDLLSAETAAEMQRRHAGMIFASVPDRAHIPFLDEPEAVAAITEWLEACG
jgi:pimeloyl-ACP methyl ester carboxylesterase